MIQEVELYDTHTGILVPKIEGDVSLPMLTAANGMVVTGSNSVLNFNQVPYPSGAIKYLVRPNLFVGVQMLDDQGNAIFKLVTHPMGDIYQVQTKLNSFQRLYPGKYHNQDYAILPLINPF